MAETRPLLVMAAGGTGGHMFPAQALAEEMLTRGWRVQLTTDPRGARYTGAFPDAVDVIELSSATFARGGLFAKAMVPFRIAAGVFGAVLRLRRDPPRAVIGFGGYPSIPALAAARILKLPRLIHEQNGVLGRVNALFARHVHQIACGTWPTVLPEGAAGTPTGNPVRGAIKARAGAAYIPPGLYPMQILVMGGSQGARILSDVVPGAIAALPEMLRQHVRIAHQARPEDLDRVTAFYEAAGIPADVQSFFDDVPTRMTEAQLVISRAGASTVADLSVIGRPSILVPFAAAIRDEQTVNAQALVDAGGAIRIPESALTETALADAILAIFDDPDGATKMAIAALGTGRSDAAQDLADLVEKTAKEKGAGHEGSGA